MNKKRHLGDKHNCWNQVAEEEEIRLRPCRGILIRSLLFFYSSLTCLPLQSRQTVIFLLSLEGRAHAYHRQDTEWAFPHLQLLVQPFSAFHFLLGPYPHVCRWHLFFCKGTADFNRRDAKIFSISEGLIGSPCTSQQHLKNTGIGNIVERSFKFLLLENVKENIQLISSYSLKLVSFSCLAFPICYLWLQQDMVGQWDVHII